MYKSTGELLRRAAIGGFIIASIVAIILGVNIVRDGEGITVLFGVLTIVGGPLVAYCFFGIFAGLGDLIIYTRTNMENVEDSIARRTRYTETQKEASKEPPKPVRKGKYLCVSCGLETEKIPCTHCGATGNVGNKFMVV